MINSYLNYYHYICFGTSLRVVDRVPETGWNYICTTVSVKRKVEIYVKNFNFEKLKISTIITLFNKRKTYLSQLSIFSNSHQTIEYFDFLRQVLSSVHE